MESSQHVHVVLLGLMGAGKSSAGRLVANELGRPFVDSDSLVQLRSGHQPVEIARREGLEVLHRWEVDEANRLLARSDAVVFAAAASIVDDIEQIQLRDAWIVWLDASPETLAERTDNDDRERPALDDDAQETLAQQHARRARRGREAADVVIDTDDVPLPDVAARICSAWRQHVRRVAAARGTEEWPQGARGR